MKGWDAREGSPTPLGATWIASEQAFNFALYSKHAEQVSLLLYQESEFVHPAFVLPFNPLRNKTGPIWHLRIPASQIPQTGYYAYRVQGPLDSEPRFESHAFDPNKILLDPYGNSVFFPPAFDRAAACGFGANAGKAPLGMLGAQEETYDWGDDRRPRHDSDLVIYEMHVRGFTMNPNSGVSAGKRGTFAGMVEKIPHLRRLGITAVELMPVFQFDDTEPNYWGYMPLNFFSPHHKYAASDGQGDPAREFREMVKALHRAGIEVILDVVYNHTGEGDERGPTFSFKGIDNSTYYMHSRDEKHPYADYAGTGNTLQCAHPAVRQLIVDSLRYWVKEMHVDGFRFDLASIFSRRSDGSINLEEPPIFEAIAGDPELARVRMIAEPWEGNFAHPNYELGASPVRGAQSSCCCQMPSCVCPPVVWTLQRSFPGTGWKQWNDKFRTTVRRFVKGDSGTLGDLATRIYGSADVFPDSLPEAYRAHQSLNYMSSHDGLTLCDLVSYNSPESWNCGGPDGENAVSPEVMRLRKQQVKNMCCLLFLSNGTPMFRAGDEFLQTQGGNANPYNVDGPATWLNWDRLREHADIFRFFQSMIAFRKSHPSIGRSVFWREEVKWHGVGTDPDWSHDSHSLAYFLRGESENDDDLYVMINGYWEPLCFVVQEGQPQEWRRVVDTARESPGDFIDPSESAGLRSSAYTVEPRSIVVLLRPRRLEAE